MEGSSLAKDTEVRKHGYVWRRTVTARPKYRMLKGEETGLIVWDLSVNGRVAFSQEEGGTTEGFDEENDMIRMHFKVNLPSRVQQRLEKSVNMDTQDQLVY